MKGEIRAELFASTQQFGGPCYLHKGLHCTLTHMPHLLHATSATPHLPHATPYTCHTCHTPQLTRATHVTCHTCHTTSYIRHTYHATRHVSHLSPCHTYHTSHLPIGTPSTYSPPIRHTCHTTPNTYHTYHTGRSASLGYWLAPCQDNVTEWDIMSWPWWHGLRVGRHACTLSQVGSRPDMTIDVARM